jgi:hypothetical protein
MLEYIETPDGEWHLFGGKSPSRQAYFSNLVELETYMKEINPLSVTMMAREPCVYVSGQKNGRWSIRLIEVAEISKLISEKTFSAFQKCFIGADRLRSLFHFHSLNIKQNAEECPASMRDFHVLWVLLIGTLHELGIALRDLFSAKVWEKIKAEPVRRQLDYFRKKLDQRIIKQIRDQAGHHLGDLDIYALGLAAYTKTAVDLEWLISEGQGPNSYYTIGAWDLLMRGLSSPTESKPEINTEQLNELMIELFSGPEDFHQILANAFIEVLNYHGIKSRIIVNAR